ncbi:hypothetical protein Y032_0084g1792 [Ancylostoma ceylanicum]|uniref:Uncharacterized protein n=1 Tax=Ancylostoma ceylanicum TaxID=53326 RepID=A0A016TQV0_9BILA|nr:hypothetical protein Y032_0084g1792 [Ancylostoma ceylanicum]
MMIKYAPGLVDSADDSDPTSSRIFVFPVVICRLHHYDFLILSFSSQWLCSAQPPIHARTSALSFCQLFLKIFEITRPSGGAQGEEATKREIWTVCAATSGRATK